MNRSVCLNAWSEDRARAEELLADAFNEWGAVDPSREAVVFLEPQRWLDAGIWHVTLTFFYRSGAP